MRADMDEIDRDLGLALRLIRDRLYFPDGSETRTVEIKARMDGIEVVREAA